MRVQWIRQWFRLGTASSSSREGACSEVTNIPGRQRIYRVDCPVRAEGPASSPHAVSGSSVEETTGPTWSKFQARDGVVTPFSAIQGDVAPSLKNGPLLTAQDLHKSYIRGGNRLRVLCGADLGVRRSEFLAIVGQSGSGKSTLLHLLATLDRPDAGKILLGPKRIDDLPSFQRDWLRNHYFGMVFQMYHLLPELTALENVMVPLMIGHGPWGLLMRWAAFRQQARACLEAVGMKERLHHKPRALSGGEMQRVAIARALVSRPQILFADEPTGNLDRATGQEVLRLLRSLNESAKLTIVMVTHDPQVAALADRTVRLMDGRIHELRA